MKILIDADACPSLSLIEEIVKQFAAPLFLYSDLNHQIESEYGQVIYVDQGFQSVDIHIVNNVKKDDLVITGDYGLALICLSKGALVIHPRGTIYNNKNIDKMMLTRHLARKNRNYTSKIKGPRKRKKEDDKLLEKNLTKLLSQKKGKKEVKDD